VRPVPALALRALAAVVALVALSPSRAEQTLSRDVLSKQDYVIGRRAFQIRCSACHSLAQGGTGLAGPNLWGLIGSKSGTREGFAGSEAMKAPAITWSADQLDTFLADPAKAVPGSRMVIPEGVPMPDRLALIAYLMLETGGADWPKPELPKVVIDPDRSKPLDQRFPSFWNHLMSNTTRYRYRTPAGELVFKAWFNKDGSVSSDQPDLRGFWHVDERDYFCYALYGIPLAPKQVVECFPVVAMSIPRFAEQLWESHPAEGTSLAGGILPGRP
jgi:cytochrome c